MHYLYIIDMIVVINTCQTKQINYDPTISYEELESSHPNIINILKENYDEKFVSKFVKLYGIDYCPVYSVIGSIISQ